MFFGDLWPLNGVALGFEIAFVKIRLPKDKNPFENKCLRKIILFYLLCGQSME